MSKITCLATTAIAGLATLFGASCQSAQTYRGTTTYVIEPAVLYGNPVNLCQGIEVILKNEFDNVLCSEECKDPNEKDCTEYDLIVSGHKNIDGILRPTYRINLKNICYAYSVGRWAIEYFTGKDSYAETGGLEIIEHNFGKKAAERMTELLGIQALMNQDNCKRWQKYYKKHYTPVGPAQK